MRARVVALVVSVGLLAGACGTGGDDATPDTITPSATEATPTEVAPPTTPATIPPTTEQSTTASTVPPVPVDAQSVESVLGPGDASEIVTVDDPPGAVFVVDGGECLGVGTSADDPAPEFVCGADDVPADQDVAVHHGGASLIDGQATARSVGFASAPGLVLCVNGDQAAVSAALVEPALGYPAIWLIDVTVPVDAPPGEVDPGFLTGLYTPTVCR